MGSGTCRTVAGRCALNLICSSRTVIARRTGHRRSGASEAQGASSGARELDCGVWTVEPSRAGGVLRRACRAVLTGAARYGDVGGGVAAVFSSRADGADGVGRGRAVGLGVGAGCTHSARLGLGRASGTEEAPARAPDGRIGGNGEVGSRRCRRYA